MKSSGQWIKLYWCSVVNLINFLNISKKENNYLKYTKYYDKVIKVKTNT